MQTKEIKEIIIEMEKLEKKIVKEEQKAKEKIDSLKWNTK